jgi:recombination protein RecA
MSSAVFSTSAAQSRPFIFDAVSNTDVGTAALGCPVERSSTEHRQHIVYSAIQNQKFPLASITPASQLAIRPTPEMASSGIPALDALTGGLPRGCLTEICGPASSGRTTMLLAALAAATRRGEYCAVIDASDALDPHSVAAAGVDLDRMLWVRCNENSPQRRQNAENAFSKNPSQNGCPISGRFCQKWGFSPQAGLNFDLNKKTRPNESTSRQSEHRLEQVLHATDLLLESGGFGLIILDLADIPPQSARRIPLTTWFRFRRAVEHKLTILLAIEQHPIAGSCSSLLLQLAVPSTQYPVSSSNLSHTQLLTELQIRAELIRSRLERKPSRSIAFETRTAWAG